MKKLINNAIIFGLMIVLTSGCNENFLDKNNPGVLSLDKLYHTNQDFNAALAGCYLSIMGPATSNVYLGDITGDNVFITSYQPSGAMVDIDKLVVSALNSDLNTSWSNNYTTIQRVNLLLDKLSGSPLSDTDKKLFAAEAKFLRAYSYFNLIRIFGGVPVYDKVIDIVTIYDVPRSSPDDVFKLIISDLTEAKNIDSYRTSADLAKAGGKASTVAAKTLLGKVYMWKKDFANAETILADVIATSGKQLETLSVLYDPDQPFNKEIIFSINYDRVGNFSTPFVTASIPYNAPIGIYPNVTTKGGSGVFMIEPAFLRKFSPDDKRASQLLATMAFSNLGIFDTWNYSTKYLDLKTTFNYWSGANTIILRYADVLLMYAEALNENGKTAQAYTYINQVRSRAGIPNLTAGFTKAQMFQALADERAKEFLLEGDRWFDMVFRGLPFLKQEMTTYFPNAYLAQNRILTVKDNCLLFPIPNTQIQIKPILTQNPGY
ncbi:MAG: RagB/SusD family nutrient uptake outer membrane protein [Prolixibacteraceae bacterium]